MRAVRALITIGVASFFLLVAAPTMFVNPPWPYTGVHYESATVLQKDVTVGVDSGSPAYHAGLRTGDVVGCLSLVDFQFLFPFFPAIVPYTGSPVRVCARHGSSAWHAVTFVPKRMPPPGLFYNTPLFAALRIAVYTLFLLVGCALVMARPGAMTWLFFGYCLASMPDATSMGMLITLPSPAYTFITAVTAGTIELGAPVLALFALTVPADMPPAGWRNILFRIIAVVAVLIAVSVIVSPATSLRGILQTNGDETFTAITIAIVIVRLLTMERHERARFAWAAFAIIFGVLVNDARNVLPNDAVSTACGYLTIVMPLCLLYAILRRHVIDVRFVLSRAVVYGIVTTLVVVVIGVVDWATSVYLSEVRAALAIDAAATIGLGLALHRFYGWIESTVDALVFRKKHEAAAYLRRAARAILRARDERTVDVALVEGPVEKLDLTMATVFRTDGTSYSAASAAGWDLPRKLTFAPGSELTRFLEAERACVAISDLRRHVTAEFIEAGALPAVAIPVFRGDDLLAFAIYGLHRDGTQLDPDELDALEHLCESAAQAYIMVELNRYERSVTVSLPAMETP